MKQVSRDEKFLRSLLHRLLHGKIGEKGLDFSVRQRVVIESLRAALLQEASRQRLRLAQYNLGDGTSIYPTLTGGYETRTHLIRQVCARLPTRAAYDCALAYKPELPHTLESIQPWTVRALRERLVHAV